MIQKHDNIKEIATDQGGDYTVVCLLNYLCLKDYHKLTGIYLSKQRKLRDHPKAIQKFNFTRNLDSAVGLAVFFVIWEAKGTVLNFSKKTVNILWFYFV